MKKFLRRVFYVFLAAIVIGAAAMYFIPLQDIATSKLKTALGTRGIKVSSLDIISLDSKQANIANLKIGDEPALNIKQITAKYFYKEVIKGKFRSVDISGLEANIYRADNAWKIGGLEELLKPKPDSATKTAIDFALLQTTLPPQINLTDSRIATQDNDLQISVPFDFSLTNSLDKISGKFTSKNLTSAGLPYDIPPLDLSTEYALGAEELTANIEAQNSKKDYQLKLKFNAPSTDIMLGKIVIGQIQFPWGEGQISAKNIQIPLNMKKPINVALNLKNIDLSTLLGEISDGKINGEGKISGVLPITYHPDGHITVQKGAAQAGEKGTLTVSPDLLPGDNAQLTIARETLQNFHYTTLKIAVSSDDNQQSILHLTVEGNNPDANGGRAVKLNVNLSGDIIPLIQQSLLAINDIKQLLHIEETQ